MNRSSLDLTEGQLSKLLSKLRYTELIRAHQVRVHRVDRASLDRMVNQAYEVLWPDPVKAAWFREVLAGNIHAVSDMLSGGVDVNEETTAMLHVFDGR